MSHTLLVVETITVEKAASMAPTYHINTEELTIASTDPAEPTITNVTANDVVFSQKLAGPGHITATVGHVKSYDDENDKLTVVIKGANNRRLCRHVNISIADFHSKLSRHLTSQQLAYVIGMGEIVRRYANATV